MAWGLRRPSGLTPHARTCHIHYHGAKPVWFVGQFRLFVFPPGQLTDDSPGLTK